MNAPLVTVYSVSSFDIIFNEDFSIELQTRFCYYFKYFISAFRYDFKNKVNEYQNYHET